MPRAHEMMDRITTLTPKRRYFEIITWINEATRSKLPQLTIQEKARIMSKCIIIEHSIVRFVFLQWHRAAIITAVEMVHSYI